MRSILYLVVLVIGNFAFSQNRENATSSINFKYEQRPNCILVEKGLYANKLFLDVNFPNLKYELQNESKESNPIGFIAIKEFSKSDLKKLASVFYHYANSIEGSYDAVKNKTKFTVTRNLEFLNDSVEKILNTKFRKFKYTVNLDYNKKMIKYKYPSGSYDYTFKENAKKLAFTENDSLNGKYSYKTDNKVYTDSVELNENYDNKITPYLVFSNTAFGVQKIVNVEYTIDLKTHSK